MNACYKTHQSIINISKMIPIFAKYSLKKAIQYENKCLFLFHNVLHFRLMYATGDGNRALSDELRWPLTNRSSNATRSL